MRPSLLKLLTLPFLVVVLALATAVALLSYRSANRAVDEPALQWLSTNVQRIGDLIDRQQVAADAQLLAAFPESAAQNEDFGREVQTLQQRLWTALRLRDEAGDSLSAVNRQGQALSVRRLSATDAELLLLTELEGMVTRQVFSVLAAARTGTPAANGTVAPGHATSQDAVPGPAGVRSSAPSEVGVVTQDPRDQAWYRLAVDAGRAVWTATQVDRSGQGLSLMRARPVMTHEGSPALVVATTLPLKPLQDALRALRLPPRGLAVVVDPDGLLVASSGGPVVRRAADGKAERVSVHSTGSAMLSLAYERLLPQLGGSSAARPGSLNLADGMPEPLLASFARVADGAGHDWAVVVVAPRDDFTGGLMANVAHTLAVALVAAALVLLLGAWVKRLLTRDAGELASSLQRIADGDLETPPGPMRSAEMGALRDGLHRMQLRLRTDHVTGLANREAVLNRLHDRMRPGRRHNDAPLLALLFVDLDRFKSINDRHGHEAGDFVLQTIGRRLRQTVRDTDLVARWAGDEFVLLLDGVGTPEHAQRARDQVERVLRDPVELGPGRDAVELDGTVGLALSPADANEPEALLKAAEEDMLQRKPSSLSQW